MKSTQHCLAGGLLLAAVCNFSTPAWANYPEFPDVGNAGGADIVVQELRWPYWNGGYYNTWVDAYLESVEGVSDQFYSGVPLPAAGSPTPTKAGINYSFWSLGNPLHPTDTITSKYSSPTTFPKQTIAEGTVLEDPGTWYFWQTNVWYRVAFRTWQPADGTPHLGYAGEWIRDGVTGIWHHTATAQTPFAVTGVNSWSGFQEDIGGGSSLPQRTDYRRLYYHHGGAWISATNFHDYNQNGTNGKSGPGAGMIDNSGLIETNTAVYLETCGGNPNYVGTITNQGNGPSYIISQPPTPTFFDPILVTNYSGSVMGGQLLVQWQIPTTSSPQFAYRINVYTNASYTGPVMATFYDIDPEARQKLLNITGVTTPYPQLTIVDIFNQTNAPVNLIVTNASLLAATPVSGLVGGLNFACYESAGNFQLATSGTNWSSMPDFSSLTPVLTGSVSGLDLTPRRRRDGYAFNYNGYINVTNDGLYTFTLNSDAGSMLYVDGQLVVNNDGQHSPVDLSGWVGLQAGYHLINVQYFCDTQPFSGYYYDSLSLSYEGPGITKTVVPVTAYFRVPSGSEPSISLTTPANGATLSGAVVPLSAVVMANGNTINSVRFYNGNNYWAQDTAAPYTASSFFWDSNTNPVHARLYYNSTNIIDSLVNQLNTTNQTQDPWQFGQVFFHDYPSGASFQSSAYSMIGDGVDLLTRQVNGDCTLIAHLSGLPSTVAAPDGSVAEAGWQAGIILRGTTNLVQGYPWGKSGSGNAPFVAVFGEVGGGTYYQDEDMVNGGGGYNRSVTSGKWFKLVRTGGTNFTSFVSPDGSSWTQVGNTNLTDFGTTIYAGLFTYAEPDGNLSVPWARFDNVSIIGNIVGPPGVTVNPQRGTAYTGQNTTLTAIPNGNAPFYYQWQLNGVNLVGATNATLLLTNLLAAASGAYTVILTNANGTASATATITVLSPPAPVAAVLSNNPVAYWRLNETTGPTAYDAMNNYNGTGEGGILFGVPGVMNAPFTGFEASNLAAQFDGTDSDVVVPAMNLNANAVTITGWIKRSGPQTSWAGIVFCRSGTTTSGLNFGTANELRYTWNNSGSTYNWNSGLVPPDGVGTFFALSISPTQAVMYMATNGTLQSATNAVANAVQAFAGPTYLGYDSSSNARRTSGSLDEVAIYNRTLTPAQVGRLLSASLAATAPSVNLLTPASGVGFATPATILLSASVVTNGHSITDVQFYNGSTLLGESTTPPYTWTWNSVPVGTYTVFAQVFYDSGGSVSSVPAFITVNPVPSAPSSITPKALAGNLMSVAWAATTDASGYVLYRNGTVVAYLSDTNYLDLGLSANTTYGYSVVATNVYGNSPSSVTNSATTLGTGTARWWDASGSTSGPQDGNGNWGTSANTWWNGLANTTWSDNNLAVFGNGATASCSVLLTNNVTPSGLLFNANNGGSYNFSSSGGSLLVLSGTPTITCYDSTTISATLNGGGFIKAGTGTLTVTGGNTNTGAIAVSGGKLVATGGGWFANRSIGSGSLAVSNGGVAEFTVAHGFGYGNGGMSATLNNGTLQFDHENYVSGLTMTAGSVMGAGEFRTTGATYSTLATAAPSVIGLSVAFYSSTTFNVARGTGRIDLLATGPANNVGSFTKSGTGIMAISGTWANSGTTTVNAGTLQVDGSIGTNTATVASSAVMAGTGAVNGAATIQNNGTLAPGDNGIGKITFASKLTLNSGSKTVMELSKTNSILTNDMVVVIGLLTLGGTLTVTNTGTAALAVGDSFDLFNAGSVSGNFSSQILPALPTNLVWDASQLTNNGIITVVSIPVITNQPQSLAVNPGSPVNFSVGVTGTGPLGYQWQFNGATVAGSATNAYFVPSAAVTNAGSYTVIITNNYGSVTSQVAKLVVNIPPAFNSVSPFGSGAFGLTAMGSSGETCVLFASTNLFSPITWLPVQTNTADSNGFFNFSDAQATNFPQRFYRLMTQ